MRTALGTLSRFVAKFLAVLFSSLFVLATILAIILFNVENTLLDAGTYKRALVKNNAYGQLPALAMDGTGMIETALAGPAGSVGEDWSFISNFTGEEWQRLISLILPPDEVRSTVESTLDQVFSTLSGETDSARLSLAGLKANLTGQAGKDAIEYLLNVQPPCTEDQVSQFRSKTPAVEGQLVFCKPAPPDLALLTAQWQEQVDASITGIPADIVLLPPASASTEDAASWRDQIARLKSLRLEIRLSPLLSLILLGLVSLLMVRSLKSWLLWWGIPLFITGLIALAIGLAIPALVNLIWVNAVLPQFPPELSASLRSLASSLAGSVAQAMAIPIRLEAVSLGLVGLAATIGSFFVKEKNKGGMPLADRVD